MTDWFKSNTSSGDYDCAYCPQVFVSRMRLLDHVNEDHRVVVAVYDMEAAYPSARRKLRLVK